MTEDHSLNNFLRRICLGGAHLLDESLTFEAESLDIQIISSRASGRVISDERIKNGLALFAVLNQECGVFMLLERVKKGLVQDMRE